MAQAAKNLHIATRDRIHAPRPRKPTTNPRAAAEICRYTPRKGS